MKDKNPVHRHFIAAPLFVFFLVVSFTSYSGNLTASLKDSDETSDVIQLAEGAQIFVTSGSVFEQEDGRSFLQEGSILIRGQGIVKIDAGSLHLTGLHGAFYVTVHSDVVTVAALTAPVLVSGSSERVLVPAGLQWRGEDLSEIPMVFKREQMELLAGFPKIITEDPVTSGKTRSLITSPFILLELPASRARRIIEQEDAILAEASSLAQAGDSEGLRMLISDPENEELFASEQGLSVLAQLLELTEEYPPLKPVILNKLLADSDLWIIASIHPYLRANSWALSHPVLDHASEILHLMAFPISNTQSEPLSDAIVQKWEDDLISFLDTASDSDVILESLSEMLIQQYRSFVRRDYPQRAAQVLSVLTNLEQRYTLEFSDELKSELKTLRTGERIDLIPEAPAEEATEVVVEEMAPSLTPQEVEERANTLLNDAGAVFTVQTTIDLEPPSIAVIEGIVFSTAQGDRMFAFYLDVISGNVSRVVSDDRTYPFELPLTAFVEWLRE